MIKLYGISNCDTVKKARTWLDKHSVDYQFIDFRKTPLKAAQLKNWAACLDWETLLNKRSRTWRELPDAQKEPLNKTHALSLMQEIPTLIKRPVLDNGGNISVGFKDSEYQSLFS